MPTGLVRVTRRLPGFGRRPATDLAIVASAIYAFNPGVIYAASYWGQLDSVPTFFMLAALALMLDRRYALAWALLAVGFFLKPQAVIIVPLLGLMSLKEIGFWPSLRAGLLGSSVLIPCYAYFMAIGEIETVYGLYRDIFLDTTTKISTSAWNLWWPFRLESLPDPNAPFLSLGPLGVTYTLASQALTVLSGLLALAYAWRSRSPAAPFIAACFLAYSFFMLPMKIHERYLFPFFAFAAPVALLNRRFALLYVVLTVTYTTNLMGVYHTLWTEFFRHDTTAIVCSYVNIVCYVFFAAYLFKETLGDWLREERAVTETERGGIAPASTS
jgi:Gpi18-like mannosyltransferase